MPIYAVKRTLNQNIGDIVNKVVRVKLWNLHDEEYELIQILGPKERVKRILKDKSNKKTKTTDPENEFSKKPKP